jgi:hypothetical protein
LWPFRQVELIPIEAHQIFKHESQPSGSRTLDHKTADDVVRAYDFDETSPDHFHERPVVNVAQFADHMCHVLLRNPVFFGVPHKHAAQTQNLSDLCKEIPENHVSSFSSIARGGIVLIDKSHSFNFLQSKCIEIKENLRG